MHLDTARKCFIRIRDVRFVELVNRTEAARKAGVPQGILLADIVAFQGRYQEAARLYTQAGLPAHMGRCAMWGNLTLGVEQLHKTIVGKHVELEKRLVLH